MRRPPSPCVWCHRSRPSGSPSRSAASHHGDVARASFYRSTGLGALGPRRGSVSRSARIALWGRCAAGCLYAANRQSAGPHTGDQQLARFALCLAIAVPVFLDHRDPGGERLPRPWGAVKRNVRRRRPPNCRCLPARRSAAPARSRRRASSDRDCCARRRGLRRCARCCPAARRACAGCSRAAKRSRASWQRQHRPVRAGQFAGADDAVEERQVLDRDGVAGHHDQQALDHVAQLADVARPAVAAQRGQRARVPRLRSPAITRARARP